MKRIFTMTLISLCLFHGSLFAADNTPRIDQRQNNQAARIAAGAVSGALTVPETAKLVRGQRQLQRHENRAKADGVVTAAERARLNRHANKQSRAISRNKKDGQRRP